MENASNPTFTLILQILYPPYRLFSRIKFYKFFLTIISLYRVSLTFPAKTHAKIIIDNIIYNS